MWPMKTIQSKDLQGAMDSAEKIYNDHHRALSSNAFQSRCLLVGDIPPHLKGLIPYLLHREDRNMVPEPVKLSMSLEKYLDYFGQGSDRATTLAVYGESLTAQDRRNLRLCEDKGFRTQHFTELFDSFDKLLNEVEETSNFLGKNKKRTIMSEIGNLRTIVK